MWLFWYKEIKKGLNINFKKLYKLGKKLALYDFFIFK